MGSSTDHIFTNYPIDEVHNETLKLTFIFRGFLVVT